MQTQPGLSSDLAVTLTPACRAHLTALATCWAERGKTTASGTWLLYSLAHSRSLEAARNAAGLEPSTSLQPMAARQLRRAALSRTGPAAPAAWAPTPGRAGNSGAPP